MTVAEKFLGGTGSPAGVYGEMASLDEEVGFLTNLSEILGPITTHVGKTAVEDLIFKYRQLPASAQKIIKEICELQISINQ